MHPDCALAKCKPLIDKYSWNVLRRLRATGVRSAELEDIRQELMMAWMTAVRLWNPELGVPFAPYLMNGMKRHIFRWANYEIEEHCFAPISIDKPLSDDNDTTIGETIASDDMPADEALYEATAKGFVLEMLSDRARQLLTMLADPPDELIDVFRAMRAKAEFAQKMGVATFIPAQISEGLVFDMMGASRPERTALRKEIAHAANKVARSLRR